MKFLVDAHLPKHLAESLKWWGYDALHTLDLMSGNQATDREVNEISISEKRIVISKDADFVNSFLLTNEPFMLLLVSTGNIPNSELLSIFKKNISIINKAFEQYAYVDITRLSLIKHR